MARKVVPEQYERNRQKIVDATIALMVKRSIAKLKLDDVAEKLGMTKAAIYWYFPSKDILIEETVDYLYKTYTEYANEVVNSRGTPMEKLQRIFEGTKDSYEYQRMGLVPVKMYLEYYSEAGLIKERIQKGYAAFYSAVEQIVQEGIACGDFNMKLSAYECTVFISGIIDGLAFQNIMLSEDTLTVKRSTVFQMLRKMLIL